MPIRRFDVFLLGATAGAGVAGAMARALPPAERRGDGPARAKGFGPGAAAAKPSDIPARGWWHILKRVFAKISADNVMAQAAGVTFYSLLAIFPALAALVSLYGLIADPNTVEHSLGALSSVLPGGGMQIVGDQLHTLSAKGGTSLGFGVAIGLATSLWSANSAIKALFDALNVVYEEREKRSYLRRTLISLTFTVCTILFLVLAMAAVVVLPAILGVVGLAEQTKTLLDWLRWPLLLVLVVVFLSALYRYGPSRTQARWRWVSWGAATAAVVWVIVSLLFSYYVANFGSYDKTYGSLGAAVGFMTWIWLSSTVVLIGGELNAEMEHQTARDTTISGRPLGQRGATKADTVAA